MRRLSERLEVRNPRLAELPWNRRCVLYNVQEATYWHNATGTVTAITVEQAHVFNMQAIRTMRLIPGLTEIHLFYDVSGDGRLCMIENIIPATVLAMLKEAPMNETARAHVLAHFRFPIPNECQTFEQIKEWVEKTVDPANIGEMFVPAPQPAGTTFQWPATPDTPTTPPANPGIGIEVEVRGREHGTCHYSVRVDGSDTIHLSENRLREFIRTAITEGHNLDRLVTMVADEIASEAIENIELNPDEDDYDHGETTDREAVFNHARLFELVRNWMENNAPDELETIDGE